MAPRATRQVTRARRDQTSDTRTSSGIFGRSGTNKDVMLFMVPKQRKTTSF